MDLIIYDYIIDKDYDMNYSTQKILYAYFCEIILHYNSCVVGYQNTYITPCDVIKMSFSLLQISRLERK